MASDSPGILAAYRPSADEVLDLLRRAEQHPLGVDFLRYGDHGAVAATFQVHAFTVDAARRHLAEAGPNSSPHLSGRL